ncbi:unnamed protein product [Rotaria sordida]|uniref:FLYWCH-type domain-containing protein n=1 Tax=Rotaria sordida TaxID=392033 RepID=A0A815JL62_9BILA|nr:unnamed protein product [Rotaria sordida]CAF1368387.1 unnamed protein product [Rotaria sordida]CAF1383735.1 unnamed protein product [Rotaria sordida]CAF1610309.1 unnamed protein product [Rotaria sordida]CAF3886307.1 unnamed protein product [Rotaria sordida]
MCTPVEFTVTTKDRPLMIIDGYCYIQDRRTDDKTYWRCENHKTFNCHYRIHTCNSTITSTHVKILKQNGNHTTSCSRDQIKISLRKFRENIVDRTYNTQESTDRVLSHCVSQLSDAARIRLPPLDHVKRTIQKQRKKNDLPQVPNDVNFLNIPTVLQITKRNDIFLRIDTEPEFAPAWNPQNLMIDFEKAVMNVFSTSFPQASLSGCYFHLRQSIHRQLQAQGLQKQYEDDIDFAHGIHKIAALAFIHPDEVTDAFTQLSTHLGDTFQSMLDYFEDNYIGRIRANGSRTRPLFAAEFWNVHERTKNLQMRTNNSAEAWNRRIKCVFQCSHPTLWKFIDKLILEEDSHIHTKICRVNAGEPIAKKKKYQYLDKRLHNLVTNPYQDIINQITALAHNIVL